MTLSLCREDSARRHVNVRGRAPGFRHVLEPSTCSSASVVGTKASATVIASHPIDGLLAGHVSSFPRSCRLTRDTWKEGMGAAFTHA